jgi:hypothetical protein
MELQTSRKVRQALIRVDESQRGAVSFAIACLAMTNIQFSLVTVD